MNDIEMKLRMSHGSSIEMAADDEAHHKICFKKMTAGFVVKENNIYSQKNIWNIISDKWNKSIILEK
jgi:hypothetical protein